MKIFILPSYLEKKDLITFFSIPNAIECDSQFLYSVLLASFQNKHEVMILETEQEEILWPLSSKRWEIGDSWAWLSHRSRAPIMETFCGSPMSYCQFKDFLRSNK